MTYANQTRDMSSKNVGTSQTVQTSGTVQNNAGGFVFALDKWERFERFLILGSDAPTYYSSSKKLTKENAQCVIDCITDNGKRTVDTIVSISDSGRAHKNEPALFALALCAGHDKASSSTRSYALSQLPKVARIGTHLFQFVNFVDSLRGWGSGLRNGISNWYKSFPSEKLALQVLKYPQRITEEGKDSSRWSHKDLLRKCHINPSSLPPEKAIVLDYVAKDKIYPQLSHSSAQLIMAAERMKTSNDPKEIAKLIEEYSLPHELVPKTLANNPIIWKSLAKNMPITATIRSLNRLTAYGVLQPFSPELKSVLSRLTDKEILRKGRVHPLQLLIAKKTYDAGKGDKGSLTWTPISEISEALEQAFYLSFETIEPSGKDILIAIDTSGSMSSLFGNLPITCREAAAVMAMVSLRSEKSTHVVSFSNTCECKPLKISKSDTLEKVVQVMSTFQWGSTDCAEPMNYCMRNKIRAECISIYTDNETWSGSIKPHEALLKMRKTMNIPVKLAVVGMTSTGFSIADPNDRGSMDFVGFDASAPAIIADFFRT